MFAGWLADKLASHRVRVIDFVYQNPFRACYGIGFSSAPQKLLSRVLTKRKQKKRVFRKANPFWVMCTSALPPHFRQTPRTHDSAARAIYYFQHFRVRRTCYDLCIVTHSFLDSHSSQLQFQIACRSFRMFLLFLCGARVLFFLPVSLLLKRSLVDTAACATRWCSLPSALHRTFYAPSLPANSLCRTCAWSACKKSAVLGSSRCRSSSAFSAVGAPPRGFRRVRRRSWLGNGRRARCKCHRTAIRKAKPCLCNYLSFVYLQRIGRGFRDSQSNQ